jgi:hypothetical protein
MSFAGRKRLLRGGVILIEFEYSDIDTRVRCAAKMREVESEQLPVIMFTDAPPLLINKRLSRSAIKWYEKVLGAGQRYFRSRFNLPLMLVGIDPLIDAGGYESENDAPEIFTCLQTFKKMGEAQKCLFWINDHAGKDVERGARGTSAKKDKPDFQLTLPEKGVEPSVSRDLTVKKLRNMQCRSTSSRLRWIPHGGEKTRRPTLA